MQSNAFQFEALVRQILEANDFTIQPPEMLGRDIGFDFTGTLGNEVWAIEVKFYRTARAQVSCLKRLHPGSQHRALSLVLGKACWLSPASFQHRLG